MLKVRTCAMALSLALGLLLAGCNGAGVSANAAPDFEFTSFDGKASTLHKQFGKPLVVNFWAVWCPPCRAEFPDFQEVYSAKSEQFRMVSVCVDRQQDPPGFVKAQGYSWEFVYDGAAEKAGASVYKITGIPRTLFINKAGELVDDHTGMMSKADFEAKLAKIL